MVKKCAVLSCGRKAGNKENPTRLFSLPSVICHQGKEMKEISNRRRALWMKRLNLSRNIAGMFFVCNEHFVKGKPAYHMNESDPDWAPCVKLDKDSAEIVQRHNRRINREHNAIPSSNMLHIEADFELSLGKEDICNADGSATEMTEDISPTILQDVETIFTDDGIVRYPTADISSEAVLDEMTILNDDTTATDTAEGNVEHHDNSDWVAAVLDLHNKCCGTSDQSSNLEQKPAAPSACAIVGEIEDEFDRLKIEVKSLHQKLEMSDMDFFEQCRNSHKLMATYTSLTNCRTFEYVFQVLRPLVVESKLAKLGLRQQLFLMFVKLTHNLTGEDLAFRFRVSEATVSRVFHKWVNIFYKLKDRVIKWPGREELLLTMPMSFRKQYRNVVSVIDCFEVQIQVPHVIADQAATYSTYKSRNTVKFLISITPQGTISFISKGYVGRNSDQNIVRTSGFLENVKAGDVVMADRGFRVEEDLALMGATLVTPAYLRENQLSQQEAEHSRTVSNVRIHVERVIGCLRQRFSIINGPVDVGFLYGEDEATTFYDKIVAVCCIIANINPTIVPLE